MPPVEHKHQLLLLFVVVTAGTACVRFGYDSFDAPSRDEAGTAGRSQGGSKAQYETTFAGATGTRTIEAAGASTSATPTSAANHTGGSAAGGLTATVVSRAGSSNTGGTAGTTTIQFGGTTNGGAAGLPAIAVGGSSISGGAGAAMGGIAGNTSISGGTNSTSITGGAGGAMGGNASSNGGSMIGGSSGTAGTSMSATPIGLSCSTALDCRLESCCKPLRVVGGTIARGASPPYTATVNDFYLDKYEVTVGRFRAFLAEYDTWRASSHPSTGEGAHDNPTIVGSGWDTAWDSNLPASAAVFTDSTHLAACGARGTWTSTAGGGTPNPENYAINCVSWYEAFAFCIWDRGRLPTEAEWQYVAGGGDEYRLYPWGALPNTDPMPANYFYNHNTPFLEVGSEPSGNSRWGHSDLAGGMAEWLLDSYALDYPTSCDNCAVLSPATYRCQRGGTFLNSAMALQTGTRGSTSPLSHLSFSGLRCARSARGT